MGQYCTICNHDRRLDIDRAIAEGLATALIGTRFGLTRDSILHHARVHLSRQLVQAFDKKKTIESMDLLNRIDRILSRAEEIFQRNFNRRRDIVALKALAESRQTIGLLATISINLHEARVRELEVSQGCNKEEEALAEAELARLINDRLNPAEVNLWLRLTARINGESDEPVVPVADYSPTAILLNNNDEQPAADYSPPAILDPSERQQVSAPPLRTRHAVPRLRVRIVNPVPIPSGTGSTRLARRDLGRALHDGD